MYVTKITSPGHCMHTYRDRIIQPDKTYMMQTNSVRSDYSSAVRTVNRANQGWQRLNAKPRKGGHWRVSVKLAGIHDYSTDRLPDSDRLWQPWHILVAEQRSPREGVGQHSCTASVSRATNSQSLLHTTILIQVPSTNKHLNNFICRYSCLIFRQVT